MVQNSESRLFEVVGREKLFEKKKGGRTSKANCELGIIAH